MDSNANKNEVCIKCLDMQFFRIFIYSDGQILIWEHIYEDR